MDGSTHSQTPLELPVSVHIRHIVALVPPGGGIADLVVGPVSIPERERGGLAITQLLQRRGTISLLFVAMLLLKWSTYKVSEVVAQCEGVITRGLVIGRDFDSSFAWVVTYTH